MNTGTMKKIKDLIDKCGMVYWEPLEALALAAGGSTTKVFKNADNIPFLVTEIIGYGYNTVTGAQSYDYKIAFKDGGAQQLLMTSPIHGFSIGSGERPTVLSSPLYVRGSAAFEATFYNIHAAQAHNIYLTFKGYKLNDQYLNRLGLV